MRKFLMVGAIFCSMMTSSVFAETVPVDTSDPSYRQGSYDRDAWEAWFAGLSGARLAGASYWAENRSHNPIPCSVAANDVPDYQISDFLTGCTQAQARLRTVDYLRQTDAQYWNGWNKKVPAPAFVSGIPSEADSTPSTPSDISPQFCYNANARRVQCR